MGARWFYHGLGLLVCGWILVPIYLLTLSAFGGNAVIDAWPKTFLPTTFAPETMAFFFGVSGVWHAILNSIIVAVMTMLFAILLGAPAGYALARFSFPGKDAYRLLILLTRAFPIAVLAVPLTVRFIKLGLYDTLLAVALVHTALALPFAILVSASLFAGIPRELEEAAWTLGCTRAQAFGRIVWPLARPGIAAAAVFAFVISWNEVFAAAVLTLRERTLPAYLLVSLAESPLPFRFAGGLFLIVPALIFLFVVRRYLFSMWGIANR